jgi:ATP-dependent Clp protease adaptor protein ClpS
MHPARHRTQEASFTMSDQPNRETPPLPTPAPETSGERAVAESPAATQQPVRTPPQRQDLPPFRVLLHNDDVHDMVFVVETLVELTPLRAESAAKIMLEAHHRGLAQVLLTHRERAELYQEQFKSKGLIVTIEPAV